MIQYQENGQFKAIKCDVADCEATNPPIPTPSLNEGLIGLGWHCRGGKHLCPKHLPDAA